MWQGIFGHDVVVERFRGIVASRRLASTYLFVGPEGIGKRTVALKLAEGLLCQTNGDTGLDPCGTCVSCKLVRAGTHPDLALIRRPADKRFLPLEAFIGDKEHRHREGLCHDIALKPQLGRGRIALIDGVDDLTLEAANCLLKTLEEPPPRSLLLLIGVRTGRQLPTVVSRCQVIRFAPLSSADVEEILRQQKLAGDAEEARRLAAASGGSLERAAELADAELWCFRRELFERLARAEWDRAGLAAAVDGFIGQAGREVAARRRRLRQVITLAATFYRELMRAAVSVSITEDADLRAAVGTTAVQGQVAAEMAAMQVERCLLALTHLDSNVNQATLLECWLDDLGPPPAAARSR